MIDLFLLSFTNILYAVLKIALIALLGGFLVRRGVVTQEHINSLSKIAVNVLLPCLIITVTFKKFNPSEQTFWWLIVVAGVVSMLAGLALAALLFLRELPAKNNLLPLTCMQNGIFLVLPIGQVVFPDQFDMFALYCFLFSLGQGQIIWSIGKHLLTADPQEKFHWHGVITPPLVMNVVAVGLVLTGLHRFVPTLVLDSASFLGDAAIPVATFILGATLGSVSLRHLPPVWDSVRVLGLKFVITPVVTIVILLLIALKTHDPLLSDLIVIESASAPATALILIVRAYGGDEQKIGSSMLIAYGLCVVVIPFWLAFWRVIV